MRKLVPSRKPTAFDPATLRRRNSGSGRRGASTFVSMTKNAASSAAPGGEHGDGLRSRPADLGRPGDGVDEDQQGGGDRDGAEGVVAPPCGADTALGYHLGGQDQRGRADGDVEEEDVLPPDVRGEDAAGEEPDRPAQRADPAPDAERLVALGPLGEHVHHDRQRGREHERRPEPLDPPHHDQEGVRGGEAAAERGAGEDDQAGHQQAASAQQVSRAAAEEQEAGEGQPVGGDHPLQVGLGKVELAADGRQGDVDDREVHDGDEVGHHQQGEGAPALARRLGRMAGPEPGGQAGGTGTSGRGSGPLTE